MMLIPLLWFLMVAYAGVYVGFYLSLDLVEARESLGSNWQGEIELVIDVLIWTGMYVSPGLIMLWQDRDPN